MNATEPVTLCTECGRESAEPTVKMCLDCYLPGKRRMPMKSGESRVIGILRDCLVIVKILVVGLR